MNTINSTGLKRYGMAPLFDPQTGITVIEPIGNKPDRIHYYYEYTRPDGAHETRLSVVLL